MTTLEALLLGIIQGLTEFFPISSSTHLALAKKLFSIRNDPPLFDLFCHLGTLLSVCVALRKDLWRVLQSFRLLSQFAFALLPLIPAYLLLKPLRPFLASYSPLFLMTTSFWLFLACRSKTFPLLASDPKSTFPKEEPGKKWLNVLCIGIAQSFALLPGISRSASTISAARILGWSWEESVRFSFLLAIPTVLGGSLIEALQMVNLTIDWGINAMGFGSALVTGLLAIRLLFWLLSFGTLRPFAWYCLTVGLLAWLL